MAKNTTLSPGLFPFSRRKDLGTRLSWIKIKKDTDFLCAEKTRLVRDLVVSIFVDSHPGIFSSALL